MKVSLMKLMRVVAAITLLCSGSLAYLVPAGSCEPSVLRPRAFLDRQAENTPFKVANQLLLDIIGKKAGAEAAQQLTEIALRDLTRGERLHILGLARFAQKDNKPIVALQVVERYLGALDRLDTDFDVTAANMPQIENAFIQHQNARLNNGPSSLLMIPIPVRLPTGQEVGTIYVPDIGGTKLAVAEVILDGAKGVTVKVTSERIPDECKKEAAGGALFDFVARNIAVFIGSLRREGAKVVSMVVSFGAKQKAIDDGEVLEVGKWPQLTGILGKNPVALLNDAFARAGLPEEIRVAGFSGDLICALYAGRYIDSGCDAAFNIGTGINGAIFVPAGEVHNWGDVQPVAGEELVPINIEMCGFADKSVRRNAYDKVLDDQSGTRGIDLFEKMTAGLYLGELARITFAALVERKVLFNGTSSEAFSTRGGLLIEDGMSAIETDTSASLDSVKVYLEAHGIMNSTLADRAMVKRTWETILRRAGRLSAPVAAGMVRRGDPNLTLEHHMVVLGGVYEHHPVLQEAFKGALAEHLGEQQGRLTLFTVDDAANVGAGVIGAIAEQGRPAAMPVPLLPASAAPAAMAI